MTIMILKRLNEVRMGRKRRGLNEDLMIVPGSHDKNKNGKKGKPLKGEGARGQSLLAKRNWRAANRKEKRKRKTYQKLSLNLQGRQTVG